MVLDRSVDGPFTRHIAFKLELSRKVLRELSLQQHTFSRYNNFCLAWCHHHPGSSFSSFVRSNHK